MRFTLHDIASVEESIQPITYDDRPYPSYIRAYPEFIRYFEKIDSIDIQDFIIGAHFVYGWMPTILKLNLKIEGVEQNNFIVDMANLVKRGERIAEENIIRLSKVINNSIVGTSKVLHFINPNIYAIWDSRVCEFIYNNSYRVQDPRAYKDYLINCAEVANENGFELFHRKINEKMGYPVTAFRAIEWVAYKAREYRAYAAQQQVEADGSPISR